jgi:hypothetical protein
VVVDHYVPTHDSWILVGTTHEGLRLEGGILTLRGHKKTGSLLLFGQRGLLGSLHSFLVGMVNSGDLGLVELRLLNV